MRRLIASIASIATVLALAAVGLATHTATSDAPADASLAYASFPILPYVEQDNLYKAMDV